MLYARSVLDTDASNKDCHPERSRAESDGAESDETPHAVLPWQTPLLFAATISVVSAGRDGQFTVSDNVWVSDCFLASVTFRVKLVVPVFIGLPESTPVVALSFRPAGNLLPGTTAHFSGAMPVPVVTWIVAVYDCLAVASDKLVVAMVGSGGTIIVNVAVATSLSALPLDA